MKFRIDAIILAVAVGGAAMAPPSLAGTHRAADRAKAGFSEIGTRVLAAGPYRVTVVLLDGRAYFSGQHADHPGHAGIPTHRLSVRIQATARVRRLPRPADLTVKTPAGPPLRPALWRESGRWIADLDLLATGSYRFRLALGKPARILEWTETLR